MLWEDLKLTLIHGKLPIWERRAFHFHGMQIGPPALALNDTPAMTEEDKNIKWELSLDLLLLGPFCVQWAALASFLSCLCVPSLQWGQEAVAQLNCSQIPP